MIMRGRRRADRGSMSLEFVVLAPGLLLFIGLLVFAGRTLIAEQAVQQAATDAAREASIARDPGSAQATASSIASATMTQQHLRCEQSTVIVDTRGFAAPVGTPAKVSATVTCTVALSDISLPGIPGSRTVRATASSALDTFRTRT